MREPEQFVLDPLIVSGGGVRVHVHVHLDTPTNAVRGPVGGLHDRDEHPEHQHRHEHRRERRDAEDAKSFLETLEQTYAQAGEKLKVARSQLDRAQREMGRAEQQRDMAQQRADAARQAAGLAGATSGLNVALKAMQDTAARNVAAAEAANAKAKLLQPTRPEQDDPNIAAAMAAASGARPTPTSLNDRLAALRQRAGGTMATQGSS